MLDQSGVPFPASSRSVAGRRPQPARPSRRSGGGADPRGMLGASSVPHAAEASGGQPARPSRAAVRWRCRSAQIRPWSAGIGESVECNAWIQATDEPPKRAAKSGRNSATRRRFRRVSPQDEESPDTPPIAGVIAWRRRRRRRARRRRCVAAGCRLVPRPVDCHCRRRRRRSVQTRLPAGASSGR